LKGTLYDSIYSLTLLQETLTQGHSYREHYSKFKGAQA
jgi:hypothetical protein